MLDNYDLHPAINKNKCFHPTPPSNISREEPPPDSHWVDALYRSCCEAMAKSPGGNNPFNKHLISSLFLGTRSRMKEALFVLFRRFSGALDKQLGLLTSSEKTILAGILLENVDACPEGFLNRALRAVSRLALPQSPDEYLYRVRQGLVEKAVTEGPPTGDESIHIWNLATRIAEKEGLGIKANHSGDSYNGEMPPALLASTLKKTFEQWFTPYELPVLLMDALLHEATKLGYEGKKGNEEGAGAVESYGIEPMSRITDAVSKLLPDLGLELNNQASWKKIFTYSYAWRYSEDGEREKTTEEDMYDEGRVHFHDLKLDFVLGSIWQALIKNNYLDPSRLGPRNLLDYAAYLKLRQDAKLQDSDLDRKVLPEAIYIRNLFQKKQYGQLGPILDVYPTYGKHLLEQPDFLVHTTELIQFLRVRTESSMSTVEIRHILLVLIAMLSMVDRYDDATLKELSRLFTEPPRHDHSYLSLALVFYPSLLPKILEAVDQHKHHWSTEVLRAMLFGAKSSMVWAWLRPNANILKQAVDCSNPKICRELLQFLERHSADDSELAGEIKELFLRSHSYHSINRINPEFISVIRFANIVAYAMQFGTRTQTLQQLLDFIIRNNRTMFNDSDLSKLLNFDYAALCHNPMKFRLVLRCLLSSEIRLSDGTPLPCLFPNAKQAPPFYAPHATAEWLPMQWDALLGGVKDATELAHMLLLRISEYKPKLPEPIAKKIIAFVLEQLSLSDLSDSKQKELFERILSNLGDTNPLLQRLLMDDTVRNQWKTNLPDLLRVLLPNHLKTLQKESDKLQQQQPQPPSNPVHWMSRSLTGLFRSDPADDLKLLNQRMEFTQRWINALTEPDHGNSSIESALMELMSDSKDFFAQNEAWHALFNACYEQILAASPPSNPSAPTAGR